MAAVMNIMPENRLTAQQALQHPWIAAAKIPWSVPGPVLEALRTFPALPRLRRLLLLVVAWALPADDDNALREHFLALASPRGTLAVPELRRALAQAGAADVAALDFWTALQEARGVQDVGGVGACCAGRSSGTGGPPEIRYSEFLAATLAAAPVSDRALRAAFRRFDQGVGTIGATDLRRVLGHCLEETGVEEFSRGVDLVGDHAVSFSAFADFIRGAPVKHPALLTPRDFERRALRGCCTVDGPDSCVVQ